MPSAAPSPRLSLDAAVSVRIVRALVELVERKGVRASALLDASQLSTEELESATKFITARETFELLERAIELTGDQALGLHWAISLSTNTFAPVSHLLMHAPTLGGAFEALSRYSRLLSDAPGYEITRANGKVSLIVASIPFGPPRLQQIVAEMVVAGFWGLLTCFYTGAGPELVAFAYPAPAYRIAYERIFGPVVAFNWPFTGIVFDQALLETTARQRDDDVRYAMESLAGRRLHNVIQTTPYALRLREFFLARFGSGQVPDMREAARFLQLSARSLRRRLTDEGTSFVAVSNQAQLAFAQSLLIDGRKTIQEVAYAMGFKTPSAFHRAFQRWSGTTPAAFRESLIGAKER